MCAGSGAGTPWGCLSHCSLGTGALCLCAVDHSGVQPTWQMEGATWKFHANLGADAVLALSPCLQEGTVMSHWGSSLWRPALTVEGGEAHGRSGCWGPSLL